MLLLRMFQVGIFSILVRHPDMFQVGIFTKHASERCRTRAFRHDLQACSTPAGQDEPLPPFRFCCTNRDYSVSCTAMVAMWLQVATIFCISCRASAPNW